MDATDYVIGAAMLKTYEDRNWKPIECWYI